MQEIQLRLDLQLALANPSIADLPQLWQDLEELLQPLPEQQQLQLAGEAIAQIVDVVCQRAQKILDELEYAQPLTREAASIEPYLSREMLEPFIRQSVSLNLDQLLAPPASRQRDKGIQSIAGECNKEALLHMLDEAQFNQAALAVAHAEAVEDWSARLREFFRQTPEPTSLTDLVQHLSMNWVEIWLGLLLVGFKLEQKGEFYDPNTILCQSAGKN